MVELGDHPVGIEAEVLCVLAHEGTLEDAAGQDVHAVLLQGLEESHADLGRLRDVSQGHAAQLAFTAEVLTEGGHGGDSMSRRGHGCGQALGAEL